jgi:hypothetical protein
MIENQDTKFETDYAYHEFFFKTLSNNGQSINEKDLDEALNFFNIEGEFANKNDIIVERTAGKDGA